LSSGSQAGAVEASLSEHEALDRACAEILEKASPLRVEPAGSEGEREACFRLRYRCVVDQGWADPSDFPDGLERDAYDELATHLCAWDGPEPAGTVRLIFPKGGVMLPIEREFGVKLRPPGEVVDGGRLVVAPGYRGEAGHRVLAALFSRCWELARAEGYSRFAALAPAPIIALYRGQGIRLEVLGEARPFWGEQRRPIIISGADPKALFSRARSG
jgi:N-acyl-L-homoserine lactone synthetase